ncbi:hypothetical protein Poly59_47630 [Rubripirellula reticaptiva]|uniref:Uncharacterized protein n=1 Tax=Rubripirellula reticaptiva TaxID=2528013 RepID=A0A5C6EKT2_9BACT|nr:hypothetical protein Poly59_47630 [Rubripirellula reticaptiva]
MQRACQLRLVEMTNSLNDDFGIFYPLGSGKFDR